MADFEAVLLAAIQYDDCILRRLRNAAVDRNDPALDLRLRRPRGERRQRDFMIRCKEVAAPHFLVAAGDFYGRRLTEARHARIANIGRFVAEYFLGVGVAQRLAWAI